MKSEIVELPEIKMLGLLARTSLAKENRPETAVIPVLLGRYFAENTPLRIPNRRYPGLTMAAYTNYESDEYGEYDYFIGEQVTEVSPPIPENLGCIIIPKGKYVKFTTSAGKMPEVVIQAWQDIWKMSGEDLGGQRKYRVDFEIYDERASDPNNTVLDIYLGIS